MFLAGLGTGKYPKDELKSVLVCITRRSVDFIRLSIFIRALMVGVQGVFNIPQPPADEFITKLLDLILNQDDPERAFVTFKDGDELVLLVHNQGGMSYLEMGAVVDETLNQLGKLKGYSFLIRLMKTFRVPRHRPRPHRPRLLHDLHEHARDLSLFAQPYQCRRGVLLHLDDETPRVARRSAQQSCLAGESGCLSSAREAEESKETGQIRGGGEGRRDRFNGAETNK